MKSLTVSIAIPTYEASQSLVLTLNSIYSNKEFSQIDQVIVAVDGNRISNKIVKQINNSKLKIVTFKKRAGQSQRLNNIFKIAKSDLLILTNDDVVLEKNAIEDIINIYSKKRADLITTQVLPLKPQNYFQTVLYMSVDLSRRITNSWNSGENYLACNGRLIALSKRFYSKLQIPQTIWNNDAYIYLFAKINGFAHVNSRAKVFYKMPLKLSEHIKQSVKYQLSQKDNQNFFEESLDRYYIIPKNIVINELRKSLLSEPIKTMIYMVLNFYTGLVAKKSQRKFNLKKGFWKTDISTK